MDSRQRAIALTGLAFLALARCGGEVPLTATEGSELSITANPTAISVFDGVSTITVVGFKAVADGGGPLTDGTQIFLTTNVGTIEERVEMRNGVAYGNLRSNGRAGLATVRARSGAGILAELVDGVLIGNAEGINILLTANPPTISPPDTTTELVATVFDNNNNRMPDVPIIFTTSAGALASMSTSLRTNALGQATDRLTLLNETSAAVTAFSGAVTSNSVTVNRGTAVEPIVTSVSPNFGERGTTLPVTIRGLNFQPGAVASFGEEISVNSVRFVNSSTLVANITISPAATTGARTVTVTNPDGSSGSLPSGFQVGTVPIVTGVNPNFGSPGQLGLLVTITGANFQGGAFVTFGPGIAVTATTVVDPNQIDVTIDISATAALGPRTVTVTNPDGATGSLVNGFTVN
jgi:hypothetical protein